MTADEDADTVDDPTEDDPTEDGAGKVPGTAALPPGRWRRWGDHLGVRIPPDRDTRSYGQLGLEFAAVMVPFFVVFTAVRVGSHHPRPFYAEWIGGGLAVVVVLRLLVAWWYVRR